MACETDGVLAWLGYATPHKWFMQGLADLSAGGFAAVTGGLAILRLGRMLRP